MKQKNGIQIEGMILPILLWVCALPIIGLVIIPWFGLKTAVAVALILLVLLLLICWSMCGGSFIKNRSN